MLKWCNDPEESLEILCFLSVESPVLVSLEFLQPPVGVGKSSSKVASHSRKNSLPSRLFGFGLYFKCIKMPLQLLLANKLASPFTGYFQDQTEEM